MKETFWTRFALVFVLLMIPTQFLLSSDYLDSLDISDMASGAPTVLYWKAGGRYMN